MSDQIDSIPIAILSVGVFVQVDSVIRWWWSKRGEREQQRRLMESDWSKIRRGETKRGFRMWLERQCCPSKSIMEEESHFPLQCPYPNDYDWNEWVKKESMSMFMAIDHRMPNAGQKVQILRRYSFIAPNVYTDIARVIYSTGEGWRPANDFQLDDRTTALTFISFLSGRICVIFIDIELRSYRVVNVPPILLIGGGWVQMLYVRRGEGKRSNRLRIVCDNSQWETQHEVISIDYEIRPSKKDPTRLFAVEVGRQSIIIPGHRTFILKSLPGTVLLQAAQPNQSSYVITIDQRGDVQIRQYDEWDRAIMTTGFERRSRKAFADFEAMLPEEWRQQRYFHRFNKHIFGYIGDSFAKRQIDVPSMMYRAAEAICQAKPDADLSILKSITGIEMFDGIHEDQEKPVPTIYLPNANELIQGDD